MEFLTFTLQQKAQCVTWYNQTQSVTSARGRFQTQYRRNTLRATPYWDGWKILIRSETLKTEVGAEGLQKRMTTFGLFATTSEIIREDPWEEKNLTWSSVDLQFTEYWKKWFICSHTRWSEFINYYLQNMLNEKRSLRGASIIYLKIKKLYAAPFFSDECVFHVSGIANTQNSRIWGTENPKHYR